MKLERYTDVLETSMEFRVKKLRTLNRMVAAVFLALLVFEFASHGVICKSQDHSDQAAMYATDYGHDDPCQTLIMCSQSRQRDQQQPRFGHDTVQHNGLSNLFEFDLALIDPNIDLSNARSSVGEIFRPPDPHFQPPEQA